MTKTIGEIIFGDDPKLGRFGIEVEVEGNQLAGFNGNHKVWRHEHDGSLRGESLEYVLKQPLDFDGAVSAISQLKQHILDNGGTCSFSYRTSTHVHVNVNDMTPVQVGNMYFLWGIIENIALRYCGEHRQGNLFCLRIRDARAVVHWAVERFTGLIKNGDADRFMNDRYRYAACNLTSIPKYGSMEFRSMRGTLDEDVLVPWLSLLGNLQELATTYTSPYEIVEEFSRIGPDAFVDKIFGENKELFATDPAEDINNMHRSLQLIQPLAFDVDWEPVEDNANEAVPTRALFDAMNNHVVLDQNNQPIGDI